MGYYCRVCCRNRPDQRFTSAGRRAHVCKECQKLPREKREYLEAMDELEGMASQANLSAKNAARLKVLSKSTDETVRGRAQVLLEVALVHPHKSKRLPYLREKYPELHEAFLRVFPVVDGEAADVAQDEAP